MAEAVLIDSSILAWYLKGNRKISEQLQILMSSQAVFVTPVSVSEILSKLRTREEMKIESIFEIMKVTEIDKEIGKLAGLILSRHACSIGQALIAATAQSLELRLWTAYPERYPSLPKETFWVV